MATGTARRASRPWTPLRRRASRPWTPLRGGTRVRPSLLLALLALLLAALLSPARPLDTAALLSEYKGAVAAHQAGDLDAALAGYKRVLGMKPDIPEVHNNVGSILLSKQEPLAALSHFREAVSAKPTYAEAHLNLAITLSEHRGEHEMAARHCREAIKIRPDYIAAYHMLGNVLQNLGLHAEAHLRFQTAEALAAQRQAEAPPDLFQWDPVALGHTRHVPAGPGGDVMMTTLSMDPPVFRLHRYLSEGECEGVMERAAPLLASSFANAGEGGGQEKRKSRTAWLEAHGDPLLESLMARAGVVTRVPPEVMRASEKLQVLHYEEGGYFDVHHESTAFLQRYATLLYYLNDVPRGGETMFPLADASGAVGGTGGRGAHEALLSDSAGGGGMAHTCSEGLVAAPRRGDAILFYNFHRNGTVDARALHAACVVREGEKWAANHWINIAPPKRAPSEELRR